MNVNTPQLWRHLIPEPSKNSHKFERGHIIILGGLQMTGAARLASEAAMRMGAGLCTIVAPVTSACVYQASAAHILFESLEDHNSFTTHFEDQRRTAAIIGPGAGLESPDSLRNLVLESLSLKKPVILDADALTVFSDHAPDLFSALHSDCILTPHEGEFTRLFPGLENTKAHRAIEAAKQSGAIIVLKGAETVIAAPDGKYVMNNHSSPYLATAGSGDVLAGMIGGLVAQKMQPLYAACAACWMHGDIAIKYGPGLVAPDIIQQIPNVFKAMVNGP